MTISAIESSHPVAERVMVTGDTLRVELSDGRCIEVPLAWYPRLLHGSNAERQKWRLIGRGQGIHWADLDEDIRVEDLLAGRPSGETERSLMRWQQARPMPG